MLIEACQEVEEILIMLGLQEVIDEGLCGFLLALC